MIRAVAIAVLALCASGLITVLALTIRQFVRHPGQRHQPRAWADEPKPATQPATIPRRDVAGAPPWNPAAGWAGGAAPDPETARLVWEAERDFRATFVTEEDQPCASGNGHVTVAEPLAPLPPDTRHASPPAGATCPPTAPSSPAISTAGHPTAAPADALTLLDERQQLIDHAAKVIADAKFDRILGMAAADA